MFTAFPMLLIVGAFTAERDIPVAACRWGKYKFRLITATLRSTYQSVDTGFLPIDLETDDVGLLVLQSFSPLPDPRRYLGREVL